MKFGRLCASCAFIAIASAAPLAAQSPMNWGWQPAPAGSFPIVQTQALAPVPLAPVPPQVNSGFSGQSGIVTGQPISTPTIVANQPVMGAPVIAAPPPANFDPYYSPAPYNGGLSAPMIAAPGMCCPSPVVPPQPVCAFPGFYVFAEVFDREAHFPNSPFAATPILADIDGVAPLDVIGFSPISSTDVDSDWGYRVGAGWRFAGGWDFGGAYESFEASGTSAIGNPAVDAAAPLVFFDLQPLLFFARDDLQVFLPLVPFPPFLLPFTLPSADAVTDTIDVDYEIIDFEAGRQFCICDSLVLRPYGGVRFAQLDHDQTTVYSDLVVGPPDELDTYTIARRTSIDGIGLRAGNYLGWKFGLSGFSVFARGELSLLKSDFNVSRTDTLVTDVGGVTPPPPPDPLITTTFTQDYEQVIPITELAAGVRFEFERFSLSGGYELENWFNVIADVNPLTGEVSRGDIGFSGWFARAAYNF
jgi:hypothetical protein